MNTTMKIFEIVKIRCDGCDKLMRIKRVQVKSFSPQDAHKEVSDHMCRTCNKLYSVPKRLRTNE